LRLSLYRRKVGVVLLKPVAGTAQAAGYEWRRLDLVDNGGHGSRDSEQVADLGDASANLSRSRPSFLPLPHHQSRLPALPTWLARAGFIGQIW
jgi:hypothetical protein